MASALLLGAAAAADVPQWLQGVWTREWGETGGTRSVEFDVHYLQTPAWFGDLRIPLDRPDMSHARAFADLSGRELAALARQKGFAGRTIVHGIQATWQHEVDFQPGASEADAGRLERLGPGRIYEHGLDGSYTEAWRAIASAGTHTLVIRTASGGRTRRLLEVAGDYFFYARNRRADLPRAQSLEAILASPGNTRAQAIDYLDCELSYGRVKGGRIPWEIQRSTLPWREAQRLDFIDQLALQDGTLSLRAPATSAERLTVPFSTLSRADLAAWFGSVPGAH